MSAKDGAKNTKGAKNFQLTLNDYDAAGDLLNYLRGLHPNYLLAVKERAPTTGHVHMHAYVQFPNSRRLSIKKLCGAHCEKCRGSPEQNIEYLKKPSSEILVEEGSPRLNYVPTIKEAEEMSAEKLASLNLNYYNIVQKLDAEKKKKISPEDYHKEIEVFWIWGESGAGKTRYAIEDMKKRGVTAFNEVKFDGNFWHGVQEDCECCLYDDWRDTHMKPTELINFVDYNRHVMNIKGGSVRNNYSLVYITSLQSPHDIYSKVPEESKKQWLRRIKMEVHVEIINS